MKIIAILLLSVLASFGIEAPPTKFATLTTTTGRTFKGVTVKKVEVDGISIAHEAGLARIPFEQLSPEIQKQLGGFDPANAKVARDAREKALAEIETGMAKQRAKEAEDKKSLVGKTPAQCNEKYGKPDAEGEGYAIYQKADIYISVNFWKGRAAKILYTKTQDEIGMSDDFTDAEFQTIMGINSSGGEWELTSKHLFYNTYASGDKSRGCYYDKRHHTLTVSTAEFSKVMAEAEAAAEKDRLKDL